MLKDKCACKCMYESLSKIVYLVFIEEFQVSREEIFMIEEIFKHSHTFRHIHFINLN